MSKLALKYLGTIDQRGLKRRHRDTLAILAHATFDRSGMSSLGWEKLAEKLECDKRTVSRVLNALEAGEFIIRHKRASKRYGGRLHDHIELVGFLSWKRNQAASRRYTYDGSVAEGQYGVWGQKQGVWGQNVPNIRKERTTYSQDLASGSTGYDGQEDDWASLESLARWEPCGGLN